MKKLLKIALIVVPLVIIIAIVVVVLMLDGIAKRTIETQATASTKLTTTLDAAHISIFGGKVSLNDLKIGSPAGFSAPNLFDMKSLKVGVSYGQLTKNPMHIGEITVDEPRLVIEQVGGKINVKAAMDQMPASEPSTMKLIIDKLQVNNTHVIIRPGVPMLKPEYSVTIPPLTLSNIGNADGSGNGAAIKDVVKQLLAAITEKLKESDQIPEEMRTWMLTNTDDLKARVQQEITTQSQKYIDQAKEQGTEQLQKGLEGLLGGKKK